MIVSTKQLADLFGVSDRAVQIWSKDKGCPKAGHGKWDVRAALHWWLENVYTTENDSESLAEAKLEYWQAKGRVETVKADVAEGKAIQVDDFKQAWVWRVSEMSNGLGAVPLRVTSLLVGKTEKQIRSTLENEIRQIVEKFARPGRFDLVG